MPSNNKTAVQIAGINTYPNPLGPNMPAGSTLQADNLRTDHPGSLTPRPGQSPLERFGNPSGTTVNVSSWLAGVKNWNWLYQLGDGLYPSWLDASNLWQVLSTNVTDGTHLTASTASAAVYGVDQELFTNIVNTPTARGLTWATDQYINLKNGVARLHSVSSSAEVRTAGLPQAAPPIVTVQDPIALSSTGSTMSYVSGSTYTLPLNGSALEDLESAAYQLLYMRTDIDGTILLGPPSAQAAATNSFYTGSATAGAPVMVYTGNTSSAFWQATQSAATSASAPSAYALPAVAWAVGGGHVDGVVQFTNSTGNGFTFVAAPGATQLALVPGVHYELAVFYQSPNAATIVSSSSYSVTVSSGAPNTACYPFTYFMAYFANAGQPYPEYQYSMFQNIDYTKTALQQSALENSSLLETAVTASNVTYAWTSGNLGTTAIYQQNQPIYFGIPGGLVVATASTLSSNLTMSTASNLVTGFPTPNSLPLAGDTVVLTDYLLSTATGEVLSGTMTAGLFGSFTATLSTSVVLPQAGFTYDPIVLGSTGTASWNTTQSAAAVATEWAGFGTTTFGIEWHGPRNVLLQLPFDQWLAYQAYNTRSSAYEAYSYQLYRSVNNPTVSSDGTVPAAATQANLVAQALLPTNIQQGATYFIPYFDQTPLTALGAALYTDPTQEGALQANYPPPPCADLTLFNNIALFGNIAQPAEMQIQLVGVTSIVGTSSLPSMQPGDTFTVSYTPTTSGDSGVLTTTLTAITSTATLGSGQFQLVTSSGVSANLNQTVKNICNELVAQGLFSQRSGGVIAWPDTAANGEPGLFTLAVTQGLGSVTLSYASSQTAGPSVNLLTPNQATAGDQLGTTSGFVDSTFGNNIYDQTPNTGNTITVVTSPVFQGSKAIHFVANPSGVPQAPYTQGLTCLLPCTGNTNYVFSLDYFESTTSGLVNINLVDNTNNGGGGAVSYTTAGTWQRLQQTYRTAVGATMLAVGVSWNNRSGNPNFYADALQVQTGSVATAWVPPAGTITASHPSPFVGVPASGTAGPTYLPSEFAYAKANIPGAVPLLNTVAVGTTTYPIRRILSCQAGTFVFKDDGIYQVSGVYGDYTVQQISSSARLVADNTAVAFQDSIMALTTAGVVIVNTSGYQIASQAIRGDLINLMKLPSIKYAFATADQYKAHYMLWLCSTAAGTVPDVCYVYNTLNNTWSRDFTKRQVAAVDLESSVLYMGAAPGTELIGLYPTATSAAQIMVEYAEGTTPSLVSQADDVFGGFTVSAGSTASQFSLVKTLAVNSASFGGMTASLQSALGPTYSSGAVFDSAGHAVGIAAATWTVSSASTSSSTGTLTISAAVTASSTSTTSAQVAGLVSTGTAYVGAAYNIAFQTLVAGDDPGHIKTFQEITLHCRNCTALSWTVSHTTDFNNAPSADKLKLYQPGFVGIPADVGWKAANAPSTTTNYAQGRGFVSKYANRGHVLYSTFATSVAASTFEVLAINFGWADNAATEER